MSTYAGLWFDANQVDVHIALTGDIDAAIEKLGPFVPRDVTVYFELAPYTEEHLCALRDSIFNDRDKLLRHGIVLSSGGCGNAQMRVEIDMSPLTPETVAYMHDRYPGPIDFRADGVIPLRPYEPPNGDVRLSAIQPSDEAQLVTCGQRPFPRSALDEPPVDLMTAGPEFDALRETFDTYREVFGDLATLPWVLAERDDYGATFLTPRGGAWLEEMVIAGQHDWVPATLADCTPQTFSIADGGSASWALDPQFAEPDNAATELHVLVSESACSGASSPVGRILPPVADYTDRELRLTIAVRPVGGVATCPGNPSLPVTIVLPEPLGGRTLGGGTDPSLLQ